MEGKAWTQKVHVSEPADALQSIYRTIADLCGVEMSRDMSYPTMWYVRPAKAQTSLRIRRTFASCFDVILVLSY